MPTVGGQSYVRWSFIVLDIAIVAVIVSAVWLYFSSASVFAWILLVVGGLALLSTVPTYYSEFRWRLEHDAAMVAYQLGRYDKAATHFRRSAERARAFGAKDNRLAQALNNLGAISADQHKFDEALSLYEQALEIYERAPGPAPNRAAEVKQNLQRLRSTAVVQAGIVEMKTTSDLAAVVRSCDEAKRLLKVYVASQDQLAMQSQQDRIAAWKGATQTLLQHLSSHHAWTPKSQAEVDSLTQTAESIAQELGL